RRGEPSVVLLLVSQNNLDALNPLMSSLLKIMQQKYSSDGYFWHKHVPTFFQLGHVPDAEKLDIEMQNALKAHKIIFLDELDQFDIQQYRLLNKFIDHEDAIVTHGIIFLIYRHQEPIPMK